MVESIISIYLCDTDENQMDRADDYRVLHAQQGYSSTIANVISCCNRKTKLLPLDLHVSIWQMFFLIPIERQNQNQLNCNWKAGL